MTPIGEGGWLAGYDGMWATGAVSLFAGRNGPGEKQAATRADRTGFGADGRAVGSH